MKQISFAACHQPGHIGFSRQRPSATAVKWLERVERRVRERLSGTAAIGCPSWRRTAIFSRLLGPRSADITLQALRDRLLSERGVKADTSMMSRFFRRIGVTFKNVWPAPSARRLVEVGANQSASTYPASEVSPSGQDGDTRASVLIKLSGSDRAAFLNQASGTPFDCQALSSSPSRKPLLIDRPVRAASISPYAAAGFNPLAAKVSPRRRIAQAILASLLANATKAILRWARLVSPWPTSQVECRAQPHGATPPALHAPRYDEDVRYYANGFRGARDLN